jgi:MFS transporter, DHA1 family, multidrug resistance protein
VIENAYGRSAQLFSLVFAVNSVGLVAAGQVGAHLVSRVSAATLMRAGLAVQTAGGVALFALTVGGHPPLGALLVPMFLVVAGCGLILPNATALALSRHGAVAGSASAIVGAVQFFVGGVTGPLAGIGGHSAILPMTVLIAASAVLGLLAGIAVGHPRAADAPHVEQGAGEDLPVVLES